MQFADIAQTVAPQDNPGADRSLGAQSMRLSDYVVRRLEEFGVRHVFMIAGGGAMHLNDSIGKASRLMYICNHHEQASAMAAEGYARVTGAPGVINVTSGPGGINALNGVFGAWTDSIPMLIISGQVKRETCMGYYDAPGLRQLGYQEADIIGMVRGITKYAKLVLQPESIRYHLERAWHLCQTGRPGPCWLDIPVDVQAAMVEPASLVGYDPAEDRANWDLAAVRQHSREFLRRLREATRPVVLVGSGVRQAQAVDLFERVADKLGIPVATGRTGQDLIPTDHPLFCGRPAADNGDRAGGFTVQNADLLLIIGCRLNVMQTGYDHRMFARQAFKMQVDADPAELRLPTARVDLPVWCDARLFLEILSEEIDTVAWRPGRHLDWLAWCRHRVARFPVVLDRHRDHRNALNPYHFVDCLIRRLGNDDIIVCGNGSAFAVASQVAQLKRGQRLFFNSGCASMGHDLPAAIGAAIAAGGKRIVCLAGDGSLQMNIQELQTIRHYNLPIKIFVLNNGGYLSIRITQTNFFGRLFGEGPTSGVTFPDIARLAETYGLAASRIERNGFEDCIDAVLGTAGPALCEVMLDPGQRFEPRSTARQLPDGRIVSPPLEDLWPFLDPEELAANMLIPLVDYEATEGVPALLPVRPSLDANVAY